MQFTPIFKPLDKPSIQYSNNFWATLSINIRDQLYLTTWLLLGAVLQGILTLLPYPNIKLIAPAILLLTYRIITPLLMTYNIIRNPYMSDVIPGRTVPVFADASGTRNGKRSIGDRKIAVIVLAARSNHPLGILAPGYKRVGDFFNAFVAELNADAEAWGFLGGSNWMSADTRGASSETMGLLYFKSSEHMHIWAHSERHVEAMKWWKKGIDGFGHIGIMHEIFEAPEKAWEGVYINYHPVGLNATSSPAVIKEEDGSGERKVWVSPVVRGDGVLRYSKGRMNRDLDAGEVDMLDNWLPKESK